MNKVIIFGSGGLAKELIGYLESDGGYEILYVVSNEPFNNPDYDEKYNVVEIAPKGTGAAYLMAVSDPDLKRKFMSENDGRWVSYAHKTAHISPFAKIGRGCFFAPHSSVSGDAVVEDFVTVNLHASVTHDCVIRSFTTLSPAVEVCGNSDIGEGVFFGTGASVLPRVKIAAGARVSAGAVVRKSILEAVTVYGDPAQPRAA